MMTPSPQLVHSFGVFSFDLNKGQSCDFCFPIGSLGATDLKAISMLCFPDSQSSTNTGNFDSIYTFSYRIRDSSEASRVSELPRSRGELAVFLQCYVYFRQVENPQSARGYSQKSFVLMSSRCRYFLDADEILNLCRRIGNKFYLAEETGCGKDVLIDAYNHVQEYGFFRDRQADWMDMGNGLSSLSTRSIELPRSPSAHSPGNRGSIMDELYSLLSGLWHVWECLLAGLPILVHYPGSADMCSKAVLAIPSLIQPVVFRGDIRPFLSIFDADYSYFRSLPGQVACIVGVTSPMAFQQLASSFSLLIVLSGEEEAGSLVDPNIFVEVAASSRARMYLSDSVTSISSGTRSRIGSLGATLSSSFSPFPANSKTYRLAIPSEAESISKRLVTGLKDLSGNRLNRALIQRHFGLLTRDFLLPFLEYIETDSSRTGSSEFLFSSSPAVKDFQPLRFIESIAGGIGRQLSGISKEKLVTLYQRFINGQTFRVWLQDSQKRGNFDSFIAHAETIVRSVTTEKVVWMSVSEREKGMEKISNLLEHHIPKDMVELRDKLTHSLSLLTP